MNLKRKMRKTMMVIVMKREKMQRRRKMWRPVQIRRKKPDSQPWRSRGWRGR